MMFANADAGQLLVQTACAVPAPETVTIDVRLFLL